MSHEVFVCYSARDKAVANAICAVLEAEGVRCWMAPRDILPGADWGESIIDAINDARAMVLVFSSNANESQSQIKREVERAVNKGIPVIPLRIENVLPTKALEYFLSTPHWLDAFTPPLDEHVRQLAYSIKRLLGKEAGERPKLTNSTPDMAEMMSPFRHSANVTTHTIKFDLKEVKIGGVPIMEWVKEPKHAAIMGALALVLVGALWWIYRPTATPEDQQEWNVAAMEDSISGYQLYLREEPSGYYRSQAQDHADQLKKEVDDAFAKAKAANTPAAWQSFMNSYSKQGLYSDEARQAYSDAVQADNGIRTAYSRALATRTPQAYQAFLAQYGNSAYAAAIRQNLAACHQVTQTGASQTRELQRSVTATDSDPNQACIQARQNGQDDLENQCSVSKGRLGTVRVLNQNVQNAGSSGSRIAGSVAGSLFGQSINVPSSFSCSAAVEASCETTDSQSRQVAVCP